MGQQATNGLHGTSPFLKSRTLGNWVRYHLFRSNLRNFEPKPNPSLSNLGLQFQVYVSLAQQTLVIGPVSISLVQILEILRAQAQSWPFSALCRLSPKSLILCSHAFRAATEMWTGQKSIKAQSYLTLRPRLDIFMNQSIYLFIYAINI